MTKHIAYLKNIEINDFFVILSLTFYKK